LILSYGVFAKTDIAILIFFNILTGLSLSSFSIFGAGMLESFPFPSEAYFATLQLIHKLRC